MQEILDSIPQRPPFLFVDTIVEKNNSSIKTQKKVTGEEDFFKGHFPGNPIMPGVLLQEALFQTGALLIGGQGESSNGVGVVTRVQNAKFKNFVKPGDILDMEVELVEKVSNAFYMRGKSRVDGKVVLSLEFACALVEETK